jgi:WD40 repeat protein
MYFSIKIIIFTLFIQTVFGAYQLKYTFNQNNGGHSSPVNLLSSVNLRVSSFNQNYLASTSQNEIRIWDIQNGALKFVFNSTNGGHSSNISTIIALRNGLLVSGSDDSSVKVWNLQNGTLRYTFNSSNGGHTNPIKSLVELENGYVASGSAVGQARVWDINLGKLKYSFSISTTSLSSYYVHNLLELDDGYMAGTIFSTNSIYVWDITIGRLKYTFGSSNGGHRNYVYALAKLRNGNLISSGDDTIKIWDIVFGKLLYSFDSTNAPASSLSNINKLFVLNSGYVASTSSNSNDYSIKIWNIEERLLRYVLNSTIGGHTDRVTSIVQDPSVGNTILFASSSVDDTIKIWNPLTGTLNYTFDRTNGGHRFPINSLASLNNGYLASGSEDYTVKVWFVR